MRLNDIKNVVHLAFQAGRYDAQIEMGVRADKVRRKEAELMLTVRGFKKCMIDKWVDNGLLKEYVGDRQNSPRFYSLREINELLTTEAIKISAKL